MKVLHLNTHEHAGGAAAVAVRLHNGLFNAGIESRLAVLFRFSANQNTMLLGSSLQRRVFIPSLNKLENFLFQSEVAQTDHHVTATYSLFPTKLYKSCNLIAKDIVHLHWVTGGFLRPYDLSRLRGPSIWTMHDTWPFTGGCHFFYRCNNFISGCNNCPEYKGKINLPRIHFMLKKTALSKLRPWIIAPSRQFLKWTQESQLLDGLPIRYIPHGIDTEKFSPVNKEFARSVLNLPVGVPLILFSAVNFIKDYNKGFDLLVDCLQKIKAKCVRFHCVLIGSDNIIEKTFPFHYYQLGKLYDEASMVLAYSAADVCICPSRCESFSLTAQEALACGTPVAGFRIGALPDMIDHKKNGWLADPYDTDSLAYGIRYMLENKDTCIKWGTNGREKIKTKFALSLVVRQYINIYEEALYARI